MSSPAERAAERIMYLASADDLYRHEVRYCVQQAIDEATADLKAELEKIRKECIRV